MFSPLVLWPCLPCIMNYQLCMTHDLATVNRHDHAWADKWAQHISTLSRQMSLMRLRGERRQHGRTGHLYETKGAWKNSPTCCTLLNVGFMIILKRTDRSVLIWACSAVLTERYSCHVQIIAVFKQNLNKTTAQFSLCHACCSRNGACEAVW